MTPTDSAGAQTNGPHSPGAGETQLVRLMLDNPQFPLLWLQLTHRARKLWERYAPYVPADAVLNDWHGKLENPLIFGIWLVLGPGDRIVGHFVLEVCFYFGTGFVMGHQLQVDTRDAVKRHKRDGTDAIVQWVHELNTIIAESGSSGRLTHFRFITPHSARIWKRWLPFELTLAEHTLTFDLGPGVAVDEV